MKKNILYLFLVLVFIVSGCTSLIYAPSRDSFHDPAKFDYTHEEVYFSSSDGTSLHGWFFPAKSDIERKGTLVQFHGNAENISTHFLSLAWLTSYGYDFFTFDYRGYGKSAGSPSPSKLNLDSLAALDQALLLHKMRGDEGKLIVYGQSLGGAVMLRAIDSFESKMFIDAVVVESSFFSYTFIAREKLSSSFFTWPFQALADLFFSDEYSPEGVISKISPIPLLVIHGDSDLIVPFYHGQRIYDLAKEPKGIWTIRGGRHINSMSFKDVRDQFLLFLEGLKKNRQ